MPKAVLCCCGEAVTHPPCAPPWPNSMGWGGAAYPSLVGSSLFWHMVGTDVSRAAAGQSEHPKGPAVFGALDMDLMAIITTIPASPSWEGSGNNSFIRKYHCMNDNVSNFIVLNGRFQLMHFLISENVWAASQVMSAASPPTVTARAQGH